MEDDSSLLPEDDPLLEDSPTLEDERHELEDPGFDIRSLLQEAEDGADPEHSSSVKEQDTGADKMKRKTAEDRMQASHLRQNLSTLDKMCEQQDLFIEKMRGELRACRQRQDLIRRQQEAMAAEIAAEGQAGNTAAVGRLQAVSRRLFVELENESDLQLRTEAALKESENTMWHIEIQEGRLEAFRTASHEEAEAAGRRLQVHAAEQLCREQEALGKVERNHLLRIRKSLHTQKEHGLRHQKLLEDARKSRRVAVRFLKASLGRIREQEKKEELECQEHLRQRMDAVVALKSSISASRDTLRKFHAWGRAKAELAEQRAQAEKKAILAQGGDAFRHLIHQCRRQELEAQKRAFEEEQKLRKQKIVSRILKEKAEEEKRKKRRPPTSATCQPTLRDKTWKYISDFCEKTTVPANMDTLAWEAAAGSRASRLVEVVSSEFMQANPAADAEEETLAEPEISGLWNEDQKQFQVPKEHLDQKPVGGTKMDKDILARTVAQLRSRVVQKQVVLGREFQGRPFNSKPELLHFKDFDVGKVYKKKITLVNTTYTISYCKLVGVEEHLQDFIHVDFNPPGPLSAGMSCEVLVTFKPMINKDLEGNVSFLAQTGEFSVPLKCSTKKCSLSLDKELIDFGSYVVGETTSRTITLTNVGGLGTSFKILPASEPCEMDDSQSILKLSSLLTYEDKSVYDKAATSISEQPLEGHEFSQVDLQSRRGAEKLDQLQEEAEPEEPERLTTTMPPSEEQTEITLGEITQGDIGPFSSIRVPIIFTPMVPGDIQARFKVTFKNHQCPTLHFRVMGMAIDVPVWVPRPSVDLKICMYDRLYQDSVLVHTRSKAALRLRFEVCKELRAHLELLPETGYIQAQSSYSVQLKFLPRHSLPEDAGKYFDKETRVLEAPMTIWVADQNKPVEFTVHAIVTTSDLELNPAEVDFGYCTIYEAIKTEIHLHNHSLLPQEFGFVRLPKFVDIQPNDGFGAILPLETLQFDVIFQPTKAKEYSFELICKSEINRCFMLSCRAVGVHPPLELSHYQIKFAATALYDTSVAKLYVINSHLSMSSLTHSKPRIGSEDASPVGPTSFEFLLPPDSPITISPSVGTVWPGKRCLVQVAFRPVLPEKLIRQEALPLLNKEMEPKFFRKDLAAQRKGLQRLSFSLLRVQNPDKLFRVCVPHVLELQKRELKPSSDEYQAAQATLARSFQAKFDTFVVPCVVASGYINNRKGSEPLSFSPHNTLYLELWCPSVAPSVVVTSHKGKTIFNFGDVAVGHRSVQKVSIQNVSPEDLALDFSLLNPNGPFVLLNPSGRLRAGETQVLVLSFSPHESILAQETLDIITKRGTLTLTLLGTGVASMVTCSIEGDVLNMGYVIARESVSSSFKLQNNSVLPITFSMHLDSLSRTWAEDQQQLPQFLSSSSQRMEVVGTQNLSGQSVFSVAPVKGVMDPGKTQDFTVTFSPDHESLYFSDRLQVVLFEKKISHQILLKGAAREHMMFVEGGDPLDVPVESLTAIPVFHPKHREASSQPGPSSPEAEELRPILVTLDYMQFDTDTQAPPATRELQVGCIRTSQLSPKKPTGAHAPQTVEFSLDSTASLQHKGFSIEPSRGSVERGQTKTISISWVPPADFDADHPLMVSALLQLRGDVKETYKVIFVAQVVT
uniref:cilia- and flagella-associated protein 74 isoform X2 n=2 Tax=Callithrix jacchus TaxID=9483 RepID=UPI00159F68A4|nr:cilia- and flagella-associated protein 74 isoform X2 [Callithrix jacchus]XP_054114669.1 cilia- and flagella-associated protein 74 isoform X2 [Callithrix jacchus]XP_054114670.1 cilia- and flagella-associated protein 74 isoform X2 [Callithrix jacchus]